MKTYIVTWSTNYGDTCCIVRAKSEEIVHKRVKKIAWEGYTIDELDLTKTGIIFKL
jgi:hypothetical protein